MTNPVLCFGYPVHTAILHVRIYARLSSKPWTNRFATHHVCTLPHVPTQNNQYTILKSGVLANRFAANTYDAQDKTSALDYHEPYAQDKTSAYAQDKTSALDYHEPHAQDKCPRLS